jgi:hypothetical protein
MMSVDFELDLSGLSEEDLDQDNHCPSGRYHIHIVDAIRDAKSQIPCLRLRYVILAGTNTSAVGCILDERLFFSEKAQKRAAIFAKRLGLIDADAFGKRSTVNWSTAIGLQAIVEIIEEEYEKKDGGKGTASKISFAGIWSLDDDRGKDVPRGKAPSTTKATPRAKAQPKATAGEFDDL